MENHSSNKRQFIHLSKAWYGKSNLAISDYVDEIMFGFYGEDGETSGEMGLRWYNLNDDKLPAANLECFEDAFSALSCLTDVIKELGKWDGKNIQPEQFCKLLKKCGFEDITKTTYPETNAVNQKQQNK